ncbi:hypothetical protein [Natrinema salsiterrestre]|uniref:Uncharacterized protein n=1 Tax=Natrinema salsiterrestre TaxID=2950540 RepID=A0A9Q4L107_9EURY|nr:hypothetical protein [Natrinema salsiterrestre]MDF9745569.1 hypothetical protein [Natrinema salsiterrestre]
MIGQRVVSLVVIGVITATVFTSGPFVPVDFTSRDSPCEGGVLSNQGTAVVQSSSLPESATLSRSEFGAEVWKLSVSDADVRMTDIRGCVRFTYEIAIGELGITSLSTTTVSEESSERTTLSIPKTTVDPDRVTEDRYDAELNLTYHGTENQTAVERTLVSRNITVEVEE